MTQPPFVTVDRAALVRRGLVLNYLTLGYNSVEAVVALVAGVVAGSVALVGFGLDSVIEVSASVTAQWRLRVDVEPTRRARAEHASHRLIGGSFLLLGIYIVIDSIRTLLGHQEPERSLPGLIILVLSVVVMPILARKKRIVATQLSSNALRSEAKQTSLCAYLSAIALAGVALNAVLGWWWADPVAALVMVPIILQEGLEGVRTKRPAGGW